MEFTNIEAGAIKAMSVEAEGIAIQELNDLQLVMVGGGNALTIIG